MQRSGLPRFFGFIVLATLLTGCGVIAEPPTPTPLPSPTQPPPTETLTPPTSTPTPTDTPAPTATPVPTQSIDVIVNHLKPVVEGTGVPEAAAYDPDKPGIHPVIFISPIHQGLYDVSLPKTWIPVNIGQTELVAAIRFNDVLLETRNYIYRAIGKVGRYRVDTEVSLREARTGNLIAATTFSGSVPPPFPGMLKAYTILKGATASPDIIVTWLKSYVEK
jgi:hypothetical protein